MKRHNKQYNPQSNVFDRSRAFKKLHHHYENLYKYRILTRAGMVLWMMEFTQVLHQQYLMEFILIQPCAMAISIVTMVLNQLINFAQKDFFSTARPAIFRIVCNVKLYVITVRYLRFLT